MSLYPLLISLAFSFSILPSEANAAATGVEGSITQASLSDALAKTWNTDSVSAPKATPNQAFNSVAGLSCDSKSHDKALILVKALDDRADAIKKLMSMRSQSPSTSYFQVGPAVFREDKTAGYAQNSWVTQSFSWDQAYQTYQQIQNTPVDEKWALLNRDVRALLKEDQKRIVSNLNLEISHSAGPVLLKTLNATETCLQTAYCSAPAFDQESVDFTQSNAIYRSFLKLVDRASDSQHKVDLLQKFRNRAKADYDYFFGFTTGNALRRTSATDFELSLDAGSLRGYEGQLENMIKSVWTSDRYRLSVKWVDASQTPNAYKISFQAGNGGNPEADRSRKIIYLFQGNQFRSLAHEIGHAMGFSDHYYDVWSSLNCQYITEINSGDIMSEVKTGKATQAEWMTLDAYYPFAGTANSAMSVSGRFVDLVK